MAVPAQRLPVVLNQERRVEPLVADDASQTWLVVRLALGADDLQRRGKDRCGTRTCKWSRAGPRDPLVGPVLTCSATYTLLSHFGHLGADMPKRGGMTR